jgi:phage tail-like protein
MNMPVSASLSVAGAVPGVGGLLSGSSFPYGLAMRFQVQVDDCDLGSWSACKGLKVELKVTRVHDGGNYWYERLIPDQIVYSPITLERAVHPQDSQTVQSWLQYVAAQWVNNATPSDPYTGATATITLLGAYGQEVMSWTLNDVYPISWSGPTLSGSDNKVAIETLELAHQGFLSSNPAVPAP